MAMSEISQLRERITLENDAAHYGLSGLASGVSKHDFIQARMERIQQVLHSVYGEDKERILARFEQEVTLLQEDAKNLYGDGSTLCHTMIQ
jgi:hypothetical protein